MNQHQETVVAQSAVRPAEVVMAADLEALPDTATELPLKQVQRGRLVFRAPTIEAKGYSPGCGGCEIIFCVYQCSRCRTGCVIV